MKTHYMVKLIKTSSRSFTEFCKGIKILKVNHYSASIYMSASLVEDYMYHFSSCTNLVHSEKKNSILSLHLELKAELL